VERVKVSELTVAEALDRVAADEAGPGEIIAVAGIDEVTISETLADPDDPRPLPVTHVDEPSLSMTIGVNTAPLSGGSGTKLTARLIKSRLDQEVVGNVAVRVWIPTVPTRGRCRPRAAARRPGRDDAPRGLRADGGECRCSPTIDGSVHEPVERVAIDVPEEYFGVVSQLLALRKGRVVEMVNHGTGWVRMAYVVPARGLIGFRTEFLTETRGTGQPITSSRAGSGPASSHGRRARWSPTGALTTAYALALQERGEMFSAPARTSTRG
jgi:GTP-binding protein